MLRSRSRGRCRRRVERICVNSSYAQDWTRDVQIRTIGFNFAQDSVPNRVAALAYRPLSV
jgi:hypothetical protein